jgi:hypothetical protein
MAPSSAFNNNQQPNLEEVRLTYSFSSGQPPKTRMRIITYRKPVLAPPTEVTTMKKTKRRRSTRRRNSLSRQQLLSNKKRDISGRKRGPHSVSTARTEALSPAKRKTWNISLRALLQQKEKTHFKK